MKLNQRGEVVDVVFVAIILLVMGWGVFAWASHEGQRHMVDTWMADCTRAGGLVHDVRTDRMECFVNGKQVVLPGWEGY